MKIKYKKLNENARVPQYQSEYAAGADLYCCDEDTVIPAGQRRLIHTGIAIECERCDVVALICARSGLANKHGITLANAVGVVDSDYRGEIMVCLANISSEDYTVTKGERIAQLMFLPVIKGEFEEGQLSDTARGGGGFGSTGK